MIEPKRLLPVLAVAGLLIALQQLLDIIVALDSVDLATPTGRVRLVTLLWSRSGSLVVADIFLCTAAVGLGHARSLAVLARAHLAAGALMLLAVPFLMVSAAGMVSSINGPGMAAFRVTVGRALLGPALLGGGALVGWRVLSASVRS